MQQFGCFGPFLSVSVIPESHSNQSPPEVRERLPRRRKSARRSEILAAAREVFAAHPYDEAAISDIAARADCVEGTIYTYFRNKRELFDAVLATFYDSLIEDIAPRFAAIHGTRDRLRFLVTRHLLISVEDPGLGAIIVRESRTRSGYFGSKLHALNRRYSRFLLQTLTDGVARGELRADLDTALARDLLFGGMEHWTFNERGRHRSFDPALAADAIVGMLLDGWTAVAPGSPLERLSQRIDRLETSLKQTGRRK